MIWYLAPEYGTRYSEDAITIVHGNKAIAQVVFTDDACIRDIWVQESYRRQGLARHLIRLVERETGVMATPMPPVSDLGRFLFK